MNKCDYLKKINVTRNEILEINGKKHFDLIKSPLVTKMPMEYTNMFNEIVMSVQ